jgi:uncharacterized protein (DUF302 family)
VILGACNPTLANRTLDVDPAAALVLPCNVVLEQADDGTRVSVVDPRQLTNDPRFADPANDAADKLQRAVDALNAPAGS